MIGQYLSQTNENATVPVLQNFLELNKACQLSWSWVEEVENTKDGWRKWRIRREATGRIKDGNREFPSVTLGIRYFGSVRYFGFHKNSVLRKIGTYRFLPKIGTNSVLVLSVRFRYLPKNNELIT